MTRGVLSALLLVALALALTEARAEPLDAATCGQLKGEQARMEQEGVRTGMAKGPEWAKANLPADRLAQIRRLLDVDEQVLFRCSGRNLVELPQDADADPAAAAKADPSKKEPPGKKDAPGPSVDKSAGKAKAPAAQPKAKEPPKAKQATQMPAAASQKDELKPAPKAWPKAKVNDAYKPPPVNPNVDPFANQPGVAK